jgi:tetratricopeptide (TPR) repeat protein
VNPLLVQALGYQQAGDLRSAETLCAKALTQNPADGDAWHLRGVLAHQAGDKASAVAFLEQAVRHQSGEAVYWSNLGLMHQAVGRLDEAIADFRRAIALQPDFEPARANLGNALNSKGDFVAAEAECRTALRLRPNLAAAENNLGVALVGQERPQEAMACFRRAVQLNPNSVDAHRNLGHVLREIGAFDEARREYETVIALNPWESKAYYSLTLTRRYTLADRPEIERLEARLAHPDLSLPDRTELHFALGKIYDDCALYDQAFAHFRQGNEALRPAWDRRQFASRIDAMIEAFSPQRVAQLPDVGNPSEQPVFIVGMPRSGTTLVEQILATSPQVAACGEVNDVPQMAAELEARSNPADWPRCLPDLAPETIREMAERYLSRRLAIHPQAARITDKMPKNSFHLGFVWRMFPRARIILCQRDPRDVCLSCYCIHFETRLEFACDLEDLGFYYGQHQRMIAHWQNVLPLRMLEVQYERLVTDPEAETRRIVEFCGLPWNERHVRFHENRNPVRTSSGWQVRQPMYRTALGRWQNYQQHLGPLLASLAKNGQPTDDFRSP